MSDSLNSSDLQKITNEPVNSVGVVLQRGGEELILEKVLYRFTIRLAAEFPSEQLSNIAWGVWQYTIPKTQLELFTIKPEQLETAISQAWDDKNLAFASHVYKFKNNPGTYVYLSDQVTIQFATWVDREKIKSISTTFKLVENKPILGLANSIGVFVNKQARENPIRITN
jgi:hypothetical protein